MSCVGTMPRLRQAKACKDLQQCDLPLVVVQERVDPDEELGVQLLHD